MKKTPIIGKYTKVFDDSIINRAKAEKIAQLLQKTSTRAALETFIGYVQCMDLNQAVSFIREDFPDIQLTESPAAAEAGADERPAAGASDTHDEQIAQDRQFAEELAAAPPTVFAQPPAAGAADVAEAKLDEDTKALFFEGALQKINNAIINKEILDIKSLLTNFDNKETKEALERYYTVASNLTQSAVRQGINKINFDTILGQLNGTYLEESSKEALKHFYTELNQKRHPENTDMDPKIAQDVDNSPRRRIDDLIAEIAEDVGVNTHESPAAGASDHTIVPTRPAAGGSDTRIRQINGDEKLARSLANQGTVVPSNQAARAAYTINDEEIAKALANQETVVPSNQAADTSRDQEIAIAFDIIDKEIADTVDNKLKMARERVDKYEQELKAMMNLDHFDPDIFLNGYKTQQEKDLVTIIYNRLPKNQQ